MDIKYTIMDYDEIDKLNFNELLTTSKDTLKVSLDGTKIIIKWSDVQPDCLTNIISKSEPYSNLEILLITSNPEWLDFSSISISGTT